MTRTIGILGGGFGLYGYLPAALGLPDTTVALPERYRATVRARAELAPYESRVRWVAEERVLWSVAATMVIARRPVDQMHLALSIPSRTSVQRVVLEKPLASDPVNAALVLDAITTRGMTVRAGFAMAYAPWSEAFTSQLRASGAPLTIEWRFRAHHFAHEQSDTQPPVWKRVHREGGGALRFYGIQLLAVLARDPGIELRVLQSQLGAMCDGSIATWSCRLQNQHGGRVDLLVDSCASQASFIVGCGDAPDTTRAGFDTTDGRMPDDAESVRWEDPFGPTLAGAASVQGLPDRRIPYLARILDADAGCDSDWIRRTTQLWSAVEAVSVTGVSAADAPFNTSRSASSDAGAA